MRVEYVLVAIVLFVIVLLVITTFAKDILPNFAAGVGNITAPLRR